MESKAVKGISHLPYDQSTTVRDWEAPDRMRFENFLTAPVACPRAIEKKDNPELLSQIRTCSKFRSGWARPHDPCRAVLFDSRRAIRYNSVRKIALDRKAVYEILFVQSGANDEACKQTSQKINERTIHMTRSS